MLVKAALEGSGAMRAGILETVRHGGGRRCRCDQGCGGHGGEYGSHRRLTRYSPIMPRIMWSSTWQW